MNQRSSASTARRKTRFVVRRGKTGIGSPPSGFGFEREKRNCGGAKIDCVPVPVRSGLCSPSERIVRIKLRYWCSSCEGSCGGEDATGAAATWS